MSDFTTEAFTLLSVGLVIIGARTYSRINQVDIRGFEGDDYLMLLAAVSLASPVLSKTGRIVENIRELRTDQT